MRYEKENSPVDAVGGLVLPTANALRSDEMCTMLAEYDMPDEGHTGMYRWQIVRVIRDDREYDFPRKLGPSSDFNAEPYLELGCGEGGCRTCTVDRFMANAETQRNSQGLNNYMLEQVEETPSLYEKFIEQEEQKNLALKRNYRTARANLGYPERT